MTLPSLFSNTVNVIQNFPITVQNFIYNNPINNVKNNPILKDNTESYEELDNVKTLKSKGTGHVKEIETGNGNNEKDVQIVNIDMPQEDNNANIVSDLIPDMDAKEEKYEEKGITNINIDDVSAKLNEVSNTSVGLLTSAFEYKIDSTDKIEEEKNSCEEQHFELSKNISISSDEVELIHEIDPLDIEYDNSIQTKNMVKLEKEICSIRPEETKIHKTYIRNKKKLKIELREFKNKKQKVTLVKFKPIKIRTHDSPKGTKTFTTTYIPEISKNKLKYVKNNMNAKESTPKINSYPSLVDNNTKQINIENNNTKENNNTTENIDDDNDNTSNEILINEELNEDSDYKSSDFEFITEDEAKIDLLKDKAYKQNDYIRWWKSNPAASNPLQCPINYQNKHVLPQGDDFLKLFRDNYSPNISNMDLRENKCILYSVSGFLGLGFEVGLMRSRNCNERTEECKETRKRILAMYYDENKLKF